MTQKRPQASDYAPNFDKYIQQVPDGDFLEILESQLNQMNKTLGPLTEKQAAFRYAPDKWSIKEVLGHINDTERVFAYRLLRIGRGDQTPLPGFEQDDFVKTANSDKRSLTSLLEEFTAIRRASISLVRSLDDASWFRRGTASGKEISTLALAFIIAGHVFHHQAIFEKQYLPALPAA
jgi:DinB superfamily